MIFIYKNLIFERITELKKKLNEANLMLDKASNSFGYCAELYDAAMKDALIKIEKTYLQTRRIAAETIINSDKYCDVESKELLCDEIQITQLNDNVIKISMPIMLPFKKLKKIKSYPNGVKKTTEKEAYSLANALQHSLRKALENFKQETNFKGSLSENITIVYRNCFAKKSVNKVPDCDNFEYKQLTDTIASQLFYGRDSCNIFSCAIKSETSDHTATEVYVVFDFDLIGAILSVINGEANTIQYPQKMRKSKCINTEKLHIHGENPYFYGCA